MSNYKFSATFSFHPHVLPALLVVAFFGPGQYSAALAQEAAATTAASTLEEIIVTATKRAESIQEVPLAITAFSGKDLADVGAHTTFDLADQTPALRIESASGLALPRFNLRGVGGDEYSPNANESVGVYMDEVFLNNTVGQGFPLFDLDRVEVLRGPQGTLWGKNTTAGAISFISRKPSADLNGYAMQTFGSFGERDVEAAVGGPLIGDQLMGRASILYNSRDGFVRDDYLGTKIGGYTQAAGRMQLLWKMGDSGQLLLNAHESHMEQTIPLYHVGYLPGGFDFNGIATSSDPFQTNQSLPSDGVVNTSGGSAKLDWNLAGDWHLTNILAIEDNNFRQALDDDATKLTIFDEYTTSSAEQVSEELRLSSPDRGPLSWIFGAYALNETLHSDYILPEDGTSPVTGADTNSKFITRNYAVFANSTIHIAPTWTARLGLRETREQKTLNQVGNYYGLSSPDSANVHLSPIPLVPFLNFVQDRTWSDLTWDASLEHQFSDNAMAYIRSAKGFKGGNYNGAIFSPGDESAVNPETLVDYEAGVKSTWFDRRVTANADVFRYDYRDLQVFILQQVSTKLENAAKASDAGVELEIAAAPTDQLLFRLSASYVDAKYNDFSNASVPFGLNAGNPVDLSGQPLERAPKETASILAQYAIPLRAGKLTLQTNWRYTSSVPFAAWVGSANLHPVPRFVPLLQTIFNETTQGAVTTGNARIAYADSADRFEIAAWAKNITDKRYKTNIYNLLFNGNTGYYLNDPLTFGVTVSYRFAGNGRE